MNGPTSVELPHFELPTVEPPVNCDSSRHNVNESISFFLQSIVRKITVVAEVAGRWTWLGLSKV